MNDIWRQDAVEVTFLVLNSVWKRVTCEIEQSNWCNVVNRKYDVPERLVKW